MRLVENGLVQQPVAVEFFFNPIFPFALVDIRGPSHDVGVLVPVLEAGC